MNNQCSTLQPKLSQMRSFFGARRSEYHVVVLVQVHDDVFGTCTRVTNQTQFAPPPVFFLACAFISSVRMVYDNYSLC